MNRLVPMLILTSIFIIGCSKDNNGDNDDNNSDELQYFPVLIEEFSHTDCSPCVSVAEAVELVLDDYESSGLSPIFVEFHPCPPGFGNDPFNDFATELHQGRTEWYYDFWELENVPQLLVDGEPLSAMDRIDPDRIASFVESARQSNRPAEITGTATINGDSIRLDASVVSDSSMEVYIFCYLTGQSIVFDSPPGDNGLSQFHMVALAEFPIQDSIYSIGTDEMEISESVEIPPEIQNATIQNYSTVVIIQDENRNIIGTNRLDVE
ncbi:hypothetical protein DRQ33_03790 [bacterium]|nr:MAG: hypothetical protein DRQ33_03790 [bacterium]